VLTLALIMAPGSFPRIGDRVRQPLAKVRLDYLRKVYAIFTGGVVSAALGALTALYVGTPTPVAGAGVAVPPMVAFIAAHPIVSILVYFGAFFAASAARRVQGLNVAALFGFTYVSGLFLAPVLFVAMMLGSQGMAMTANPVRDAFLLSVAAFGGLTSYVLVTRKDFSFLRGFLVMGIVVLIVASLIGLFVGGQIFQLAIASAGVLLFGGYVLYDTSRLLHSDEPLDPVGAALSLFLDFLNLFVFILRILMSSRRE